MPLKPEQIFWRNKPATELSREELLEALAHLVGRIEQHGEDLRTLFGLVRVTRKGGG